MNQINNVEFPKFEPAGPCCKNPECDGVLWPYASLKHPVEIWEQCTVCKQQFGRMPAKDVIDYTFRLINRILKGEKEN